MIYTVKTGKNYFIQIRTKEDYIYWLDLFKKGFWCCGLKDVLCEYSVNKRIRHRTKLAKKQWWVYRDIEKMNIGKATYYVLMYAFKGFAKNYL